jgi:hypothetical protein
VRGGECKECTGYLVELGGVYKQNAALTRDYSLRMLEYMGARKDYESRIAGMQDDTSSLVSSVKLLEEIKADQRATIDSMHEELICHE